MMPTYNKVTTNGANTAEKEFPIPLYAQTRTHSQTLCAEQHERQLVIGCKTTRASRFMIQIDTEKNDW